MAFIPCDLVLLEKHPVFLLKRGFSVVLFLSVYVGNDGFKHGLAYRKNSVSRLPCEITKRGRALFYPLAGYSFQFLYPLGNGNRTVKARENVNMVFNSADSHRVAMELFGHAAEIGVHFRAQRAVTQKGGSVFCGEDEVLIGSCEGLRHGAKINGVGRMRISEDTEDTTPLGLVFVCFRYPR